MEPTGPWAPYQPTRDDPWDLRKVAHLHRRAAFGATRSELQRDLADGPARSVERLLNPPEAPREERDLQPGMRDAALSSGDPQRLKAWWLYRMLYGHDPLREKLTLFWHCHFATSNRKVRSVALMLRQNETFRRHALGDFRKLLAEMVTDPAMLAWLDGSYNRKRTCNENFGREFLELFTLGVGHYTEADVRAAARAFTGWVGEPGSDLAATGYRFEPDDFDDDDKTFLKRTGPWGWRDVVRITLEHPAATEMLCRKLYRFLVAEEPPATPELIRPLAERLRSGGYAVRDVVSTILRSRHFFSRAAYRARVKSPVEYSAGLVRLLDVPREDVRLLAVANACDRQGQELFYPPSVKGWDGGRAWLGTSAALERSNWVADLVWGNPEMGMKRFDPLRWAADNGLDRAKAVDALADLVVQGDLSGPALTLIRRAAEGGTADGLRKALQIVLHCPTSQLA